MVKPFEKALYFYDDIVGITHNLCTGMLKAMEVLLKFIMKGS
jgi:hypothetical protein